ncbi:MAG TPA: tyrosine--tRNA ligase [Patescibacteria group bacterium]|nr:tyrosine--tRNA ligase [Patescibacteria group bacterium]
MNIFDTLKERGFIKQCTDESGLQKALQGGSLTFYCGFDPTADSLHVGSLVPIMTMAHLQKAGHKPIAIVGAGTAMIGDPSGRTSMRRIMDNVEITASGKKILKQIKRYLDLSKNKGVALDNSKWLSKINYIEFLRDIGKYFKVNEMIKAEAYKQRLEREEGLSFLEFNYQLLQAYDFLVLYRKYDCVLQFGGDDQWGNIIAGVNLVHRVTGKEVYGLTFPLVTTANGAKMGKTEAGAVWLDEKKTSPYEFYQYWVNTDDRDVERFLMLFTFLPAQEIKALCAQTGEKINEAKRVLAYEATKLTHGEASAKKAQTASQSAFQKGGDDLSAIPTTTISRSRLESGISLIDLFVETGLVSSKGEARRLIEQGGASVNDKKISSPDERITLNSLRDNTILLRVGKKKYHRVLVN